MKITLTKSGGLMPGLPRPFQTIDSAHLGTEAVEEMARLLSAAKASPAKPVVGQAADPLEYTITVEDAGSRMDLQQSDATMSEEFASLLSWIRKNAGTSRA